MKVKVLVLKCKRLINNCYEMAGNSEVSRPYIRIKTISYFCDVEIRPPGYGYPRLAAAYIGTHISLSYYG